MHLPLSFRVVDREGLAASIGNLTNLDLQSGVAVDLAEIHIPDRGAVVGHFGLEQSGPLPEFLIVRDEDLNDTYAWVSSYFVGLTPISQWCRIWKQSEFGRLDFVSEPRLKRRLGPWIGAIIGECLVQANYRISLKDIPGAAALATATFAAARGSAVWGDLLEVEHLAQRYDDLHQRYSSSARTLSGRNLQPLWFVLSDTQRISRETVGLRAMGEVSRLLDEVSLSGVEDFKEVARRAAREFGLRELEGCAQGAQAQRVEALDRLASRLLEGPGSPVNDALLGFGASLVDPGAAALPELLRRYAERMPMAPLWLGAFAGAWSPAKVINDNQGLGRLVMKALEATPDLSERPSADISYEELSRWLGPSGSKRPPVRAMSARNLNVEIIPGVIAPFSLPPEGQTESSARPRQESVPDRRPPVAQGRDNMSEIMRAVRELRDRVAFLETRNSGETAELPGLEAPIRGSSKPSSRKAKAR